MFVYFSVKFTLLSSIFRIDVLAKMSAEALAAMQNATERIRENYKDIGADAEALSARIIASFQSAFDKPPIEEFEAILQKRFTADEVRVALLAPRDDQVKYYPLLLMATIQPEIQKLQKLDVEHPLIRLKSLVLSTIFLLHRHSWKGFLEEFVIRGGLDTLAHMIAEPNLYYRGQVVEILLTITDCDAFDWFLPRSDVMGRTLHIRFLELSDHPTFLENLISNRIGSYPGASMRCLQLMAFWLSWVRAMYTKNQLLNLSKTLLAELKHWAEQGPEGVNSTLVGNVTTKAIPRAQADGSIDVSSVSGDDVVLEMDADSAAISAAAVARESVTGDATVAPEEEEEETEDEKKIREEEKQLAQTLLQDFSHDQYQRDGMDDISSSSSSPAAGGGGLNEISQAAAGFADSNSKSGLSVRGIDRPAVDATVQADVKEAFERIGDSISFRSETTDAHKVAAREKADATAAAQAAAALAAQQAAAPVDLTAAQHKEKGNFAFGRGDYMDALDLYNSALGAFQQGAHGTSTSTQEEKDEMESSLHFNCAACHWKIYTKKTSTGKEVSKPTYLPGKKGSSSSSSSGSGSGAADSQEYMDFNLLKLTASLTVEEVLESCALHCKEALRIQPGHYKAGYRLGAVLLAQSKPEAALQIVDAALTLLTSSPVASDGGADSTYTSLKELRTRCVAAFMLSAGGNTANSGKNSTDLPVAKGLSSRAAGILASLQRRKVREDSRETHALSSTYTPPTADEEEEQAVRDTKQKKKAVRDGDDKDVSEYFGASNIYTGAGAGGTSKKASGGATKKGSDGSAAGVTVSAGSEDAVRKAARAAEKKAMRKRLLDAVAVLKKCVLAMEKGTYSASVLLVQQQALLESLNVLWSIPVAVGKKAVHSLNSAFAEASIALEEPLVTTLVFLAESLLTTDSSAAVDRSAGVHCVVDLVNIDRMQSVLSMALYGNEPLKQACAAVARLIEGTPGLGEKAENAGKLLLSYS